MTVSRRNFLALAATSTLVPKLGNAGIDRSIVNRHDEKLEETLKRQVVDSTSRWCGGCCDSWGLYHCGSASGILNHGCAAYFNKDSRFYRDRALFERLQLAAGFLDRMQGPQGNIDLLTTNFNSPPDTGFVVHGTATAAKLAAMNDDDKVLSLMEPFLRRAGAALAQGGIHTPNHRWVVSAALAQINDIFPDPKYVKRIDRWLAEGIDIDKEGQFIERSTTVYNSVCDYSFVVMAHKLKRPELLEPVRKNLDAMLYLLHPNFEAVTEISRRQDLNTRAGMERYWLPLRYMAIHDRNGNYATIVNHLEPNRINLASLMEYPQLQKDLPASEPIPDRYRKQYPLSEVTRIRNGKTSVTIMLRENNRWISLRNGDAIVNAVRFASAFFGKGQFVPREYQIIDEKTYTFRQELVGPYYQPLSESDKRSVNRKNWGAVRSQRTKSEICKMVYEGKIKETDKGFEITVSAKGTDNVPLAIEISLREGGELSNVEPAPNVSDAFLLKKGYAEYRVGKDGLRIGPGHFEHAYTQIRGAEPKLPGKSVYVTGFTPFERTLTIEWI